MGILNAQHTGVELRDFFPKEWIASKGINKIDVRIRWGQNEKGRLGRLRKDMVYFFNEDGEIVGSDCKECIPDTSIVYRAFKTDRLDSIIEIRNYQHHILYDSLIHIYYYDDLNRLYEIETLGIGPQRWNYSPAQNRAYARELYRLQRFIFNEDETAPIQTFAFEYDQREESRQINDIYFFYNSDGWPLSAVIHHFDRDSGERWLALKQYYFYEID
ncbi:MAG: hypothetical protein AAFY91_16385 [Bacteroidota bacterium]